MEKPKREDYGYIDPLMGMDGEGGWVIEGGEEAYYEALEKYLESQNNDIPDGFDILKMKVYGPDCVESIKDPNKF